MNLFEKIKLPKPLKGATKAEMKFSIGEKGDFEETFKEQSGLLNRMPSVHEHSNKDVDPDRPRIM